jgi:RNA polymerase sigma-70 factor (ECF subfamily)
MGNADQDQPLHEIETEWSDILRAHRDEGEADDARARVALRYIAAVRRYLTWVLRDGDTAAELAQEFAVRVLRGDFRHADPNRGRFRDFVRAAASNLVHDYYRRKKARPATGSAETPEPVAPPVEPSDELDAEFLRSWRMELFGRAMAALAAYQERTGRPYHDMITLRTSEPHLTSSEMAARHSARGGKPIGDVWVRQTLRRARALLADLLLDEVAASLRDVSFEGLERELITLDLLDYCQDSLRRRARRTRASPAD